MSVTTFSYEYTSPIFPPRILKASIVDSHNLIPKLMPQVIKSIEITQRNGNSLTAKLEKITYEVKFEPNTEGGSISKVTSKYYTKGQILLKQDKIKTGKEKLLGMYKVVEAYLLQNPRPMLNSYCHFQCTVTLCLWFVIRT
ncbi:hypothetical protein M9H77_35295 [Catharanthus roseus]|uniref:Uncharacterized protein n=1 Tax=Catharanthus roseus TaxID=4058 RepID=A0ACB9ZPC6_CATRO|nr:hypothetical protein M9H77_35295 [Catharanthus roseus]